MKNAVCLLLLCLCIPGWAQLSRDQVHALLTGDDPHAAATAMGKEGLAFEPDQALFDELCANPQVMRLLLAGLVRVSGGESTARPLLATEISQDPNALVIQKIYELTNNLNVANRMETTPDVIDRRLGFRDFLVRTVMEPNHNIALKAIEEKLGSEEYLPDWVESLVNASVSAKKEGYPMVKFKAKRSANLTLSTSERGIQGFLGLYMVNASPEAEGFSLEDNLIYTHPTFPLNYDTKEADFNPGKIEKSLITTLNLTKIFRKTQPLKLFPGTWGIRFKHTNGEGSLRSDRTEYFQVEPGQNYNMQFSWETDNRGIGRMAMKLIPVDKL